MRTLLRLGRPPATHLFHQVRPSSLLLAFVSCVALAACQSHRPGSLSWTESGRESGLDSFRRVIVRDFDEHVSASYDRSPLEIREAVRARMSEARVSVPNALAKALDTTAAFEDVRREGLPDAATLVVEGVIVRFDEGSADTRRFTSSRAGNTQVEVRLSLRGGVSGQPLATFVVENAPAGVYPAPQSATSLDNAVNRVASQAADVIAEERQHPARTTNPTL